MPRHQLLVPYLFLSPAIVMFATFVMYPFVGSMLLSVTDWNGMSETSNFIGLDNYRKMFQDAIFWQSLSNNIVWMIVVSGVSIGAGLFLAVLLWSKPIGYTFFRSVFFVPQVLGPAIVGVIWLVMYQPRRGTLYTIGEMTGLSFLTHGFLGDPATALGAVMVAEVWYAFGFFMVIFLAGLQSVDTQLIDASKLDGAGFFQRFRHVIIPQLAPILTLALILALISSLNVFDIIFAMTGGGPGHASEVLGTFTYRKAFRENQVGYGAALTVIIAALALAVSAALMYFRRKSDAGFRPE